MEEFIKEKYYDIKILDNNIKELLKRIEELEFKVEDITITVNDLKNKIKNEFDTNKKGGE